ncbi:MAG: carbonic anhydrase [Rhodospirillales bacterium]|nr:carbonic anhydrase [Rhodospirillales bacterium]
MVTTPIDRLIAGFKGFRATYYEQRPERFQALIERGQSPQVMIIACSDSRADPAILTNAEPGELFIVRNVANLVPPYEPDGHYHGTSAAIEFGVKGLGVRHVVVLGHSGCGGVRRLVQGVHEDGPHADEFVGTWMTIANQACKRGHDADEDAVGRGAVAISLANLHSFPWVRDALLAGRLELHGWWFDLANGTLWRYDETLDDFQPMG